MARIAMDDFEEGTEIVRVYVAGSLTEAQAVEAVLAGAGVDYGVEVEALPSGGLLSGRARSAAGFWVPAEAVEASAGALERAGHLRGLVDRG